MAKSPPIVLVFAASDPTGGAGVQADILTLAAREAIEDFAIENERAMDAPALGQGRVQRGVIETAQIAPEPHHRDIVGHLRCVLRGARHAPAGRKRL